eukprot:m.268220 g.268220  ORF g.268220 m.268220 type:complete len:1942 (-) comp15654_c0_seq1:230-6055(-)
MAAAEEEDAAVEHHVLNPSHSVLTAGKDTFTTSKWMAPAALALVEFIDNSLMYLTLSDRAYQPQMGRVRVHVFEKKPRGKGKGRGQTRRLDRLAVFDNGTGMGRDELKVLGSYHKKISERENYQYLISQFKNPAAKFHMFLSGLLSVFGTGSKAAAFLLGKVMTVITSDGHCGHSLVMDMDVMKRKSQGTEEEQTKVFEFPITRLSLEDQVAALQAQNLKMPKAGSFTLIIVENMIPGPADDLLREDLIVKQLEEMYAYYIGDVIAPQQLSLEKLPSNMFPSIETRPTMDLKLKYFPVGGKPTVFSCGATKQCYEHICQLTARSAFFFIANLLDHDGKEIVVMGALRYHPCVGGEETKPSPPQDEGRQDDAADTSAADYMAEQVGKQEKVETVFQVYYRGRLIPDAAVTRLYPFSRLTRGGIARKDWPVAEPVFARVSGSLFIAEPFRLGNTKLQMASRGTEPAFPQSLQNIFATSSSTEITCYTSDDADVSTQKTPKFRKVEEVQLHYIKWLTHCHKSFDQVMQLHTLIDTDFKYSSTKGIIDCYLYKHADLNGQTWVVGESYVEIAGKKKDDRPTIAQLHSIMVRKQGCPEENPAKLVVGGDVKAILGFQQVDSSARSGTIQHMRPGELYRMTLLAKGEAERRLKRREKELPAKFVFHASAPSSEHLPNDAEDLLATDSIGPFDVTVETAAGQPVRKKILQECSLTFVWTITPSDGTEPSRFEYQCNASASGRFSFKRFGPRDAGEVRMSFHLKSKMKQIAAAVTAPINLEEVYTVQFRAGAIKELHVTPHEKIVSCSMSKLKFDVLWSDGTTVAVYKQHPQLMEELSKVLRLTCSHLQLGKPSFKRGVLSVPIGGVTDKVPSGSVGLNTTIRFSSVEGTSCSVAIEIVPDQHSISARTNLHLQFKATEHPTVAFLGVAPYPELYVLDNWNMACKHKKSSDKWKVLVSLNSLRVYEYEISGDGEAFPRYPWSVLDPDVPNIRTMDDKLRFSFALVGDDGKVLPGVRLANAWFTVDKLKFPHRFSIGQGGNRVVQRISEKNSEPLTLELKAAPQQKLDDIDFKFFMANGAEVDVTKFSIIVKQQSKALPPSVLQSRMLPPLRGPVSVKDEPREYTIEVELKPDKQARSISSSVKILVYPIAGVAASMKVHFILPEYQVGHTLGAHDGLVVTLLDKFENVVSTRDASKLFIESTGLDLTTLSPSLTAYPDQDASFVVQNVPVKGTIGQHKVTVRYGDISAETMLTILPGAPTALKLLLEDGEPPQDVQQVVFGEPWQPAPAFQLVDAAGCFCENWTGQLVASFGAVRAKPDKPIPVKNGKGTFPLWTIKEAIDTSFVVKFSINKLKRRARDELETTLRCVMVPSPTIPLSYRFVVPTQVKDEHGQRIFEQAKPQHMVAGEQLELSLEALNFKGDALAASDWISTASILVQSLSTKETWHVALKQVEDTVLVQLPSSVSTRADQYSLQVTGHSQTLPLTVTPGNIARLHVMVATTPTRSDGNSLFGALPIRLQDQHNNIVSDPARKVLISVQSSTGGLVPLLSAPEASFQTLRDVTLLPSDAPSGSYVAVLTIPNTALTAQLPFEFVNAAQETEAHQKRARSLQTINEQIVQLSNRVTSFEEKKERLAHEMRSRSSKHRKAMAAVEQGATALHIPPMPLVQLEETIKKKVDAFQQNNVPRRPQQDDRVLGHLNELFAVTDPVIGKIVEHRAWRNLGVLVCRNREAANQYEVRRQQPFSTAHSRSTMVMVAKEPLQRPPPRPSDPSQGYPLLSMIVPTRCAGRDQGLVMGALNRVLGSVLIFKTHTEAKAYSDKSRRGHPVLYSRDGHVISPNGISGGSQGYFKQPREEPCSRVNVSPPQQWIDLYRAVKGAAQLEAQIQEAKQKVDEHEREAPRQENESLKQLMAMAKTLNQEIQAAEKRSKLLRGAPAGKGQPPAKRAHRT